jgi:hypothetical protein
MRPLTDNTEQWEDVLKDISKDTIPIDCVKKVLFKLKGGKQKTINLVRLKKEGLELEEIETVITRTIIDMDSKIINMDFVIDIQAVAELVEPMTNKLLKDLN